ncbi:MAG TPA: hypothetical protein VFQ45_18085 [Longimicrobium sp.]|nr:hypothetical protein [Longimicrobium sp.]
MSADNLAFHAADPRGGEGYVILLHPPEADGTVRCQEWSSVDYMAPGRESVVRADELMARVEGWRREGWKLTESPERIRGWLRPPE